jgi:hypothetical protein
MSLFEKVKGAINSMGQIELSGIRLEDASPRLLDIGDLDLDRHVAMQPSAVAYYGAMKKEADRTLAFLKRGFNRWEKKKWAMAKAAVLSGTTAGWKPTIADIESRFIADNEPELEEWDKKLDTAQEQSDTLDAWYEAWRQKSFALHDHASVAEDSRWNSSSSISKPSQGRSDKLEMVRGLIRRRKQESQGAPVGAHAGQ